MADLRHIYTAPRRALVHVGHHFLLNVLPFREPESRQALATFVSQASRTDLPSIDRDAVLLRCLVVLSRHTDGRMPSLVEQYLSTSSPKDHLARFSECIEQLLRYRCVRDGAVQEAINIIASRYADPSCTPALIAAALGVRLSSLCVAFKRATNRTLGEEIRNVRLEHAARLLATTQKTVKEVWVDVGYNHASNFAHDFKRRFGVAAREYRARAIRPLAAAVYGRIDSYAGNLPGVAADAASVLIVEEDPYSRSTIAGFLRREGYTVHVEATGAAGLHEWDQTGADVILLGCHLDDMDGMEFLRQLRKRPGGRVPPAAILAADWDMFDRADEIREMNAIIVSKICDLDLIKEIVVYLLRRRSEASVPATADSQLSYLELV